MKKLVLGLFFFPTLFLMAQGVQTVRGTVLDKQSKFQIPGVVVTLALADKNLVTSTNDEGEFSFENVPVGRVNLVFKMIGYNDATLSNLLVQQGKQTVLNVELEERVIQAEEVIVKAEVDKTQSINEMAVVSSRQFSVEETNRYAGALNDPSRMASNFAGVSSANDSRNDIVIRGNSPLGLLWRMDGLPIFNPNHFGASGTTGGPVSMLNNNLLANSDFMTGAFPAEYGNALSGVFDLNMRKGNNRKREHLGQIGFNGFELGTEGPFSKNSNASYLLNYRYSTLAIFKLMGLSFGTGQAIPQYQDASMKIDLPTKKAGRFSLFAIGGLSYIELLDSEKDTTKKGTDFYGNGGYDTYFRSNTGMVGLNHTYFYNPTTSHKLGVVLNGQYNSIHQDSLDINNLKRKFDDVKGERTESRITFNAQLNKKFSAKNTLHTGTYVHLIRYDMVDKISEPYGWREVRNIKSSTLLSEAFIQWKHRINDAWAMNLGLHGQHLALNNSAAIEPRAGLKYMFNKTQSFQFGAGIHNQTQPIMVYEIKTRKNDGTYQFTNRNLDFTRASHLVLGYDNSFAPNWRLKSEVYYQYLDKAPVEQRPSSYSALNAGTDFVVPLNDSLTSKGIGYNYGLELTLEKFLSKGFYLLMTTSVFESKYWGSDNVKRNTAFNTNYVANFLTGKEFKINKLTTFVADVRVTYSGGRRYIPIDLDLSRTNSRTEFDNSNPYRNQYAPYFRPDLKLTLRKESKSGKFTQEFALNIQNVVNHQNIFAENYDRKSREITKVNQMGFMPVPQYRILF